MKPDERIAKFGQAIALSLEGLSHVQIAKRLGIARSTLFLWRDDLAYRALEAEQHRQLRESASAEMTDMVSDAVDVVRQILRAKDPYRARARLPGAQEVFDRIGLAPSAERRPVDDATDEQIDELMARMGYVRAAKPDAEGKH